MASIQNDNSDDEPPFNFQGLLRKTNYNRASMKRTISDNRMSATNIDFEDYNNNSNNVAKSTKSHFNRSEGNVVYQSKVIENRPKSCQGLDMNDKPSTSSQRKLSLSQDTMMANEPKAEHSRSHSPSPFDENRNNYVQEEIAPGIFIEGYVEDL